AVSEAFLAGMRRLRRPVRPHAAPALRIFDNWAVWACAVLVGVALVLAGMAYVDPVIQSAQHGITGWPARFFEIVTDVGKSGWLLWPT
ncbi:hypothetical protein, partial [Klebsiella pneumoniae]|uniref:hypothetical protein n=1 Tax=Klebsiella pneumoniae TaxID=573 RepID=UPI001952FBB4